MFSERKQHSKDLYDVYKRLVHIYFRKERDQSIGFKVPVNYEDSFNHMMMFEHKEPDLMSVDKIENFDWAMQHLKDKKYQDIHHAWVEMDEHRVRISELIPKLIPSFERATRERMHQSFPNFVVAEETEEKEKSAYSLPKIADKLHEQYDRIMDGNGKILVECEAYGNKGYYIISLYGTHIMSAPRKDDLDVDRIQDTLSSILKDEELVRYIAAVQDTWQKLRDAKTRFEKQLGRRNGTVDRSL